MLSTNLAPFLALIFFLYKRKEFGEVIKDYWAFLLIFFFLGLVAGESVHHFYSKEDEISSFAREESEHISKWHDMNLKLNLLDDRIIEYEELQNKNSKHRLKSRYRNNKI